MNDKEYYNILSRYIGIGKDIDTNVNKNIEKELEIRFKFDFQISEILNKIKKLQKYDIGKEISIIEYHNIDNNKKQSKRIVKYSYPEIKDISQNKITIFKDDFNIQGFPFRISYAHEIKNEFDLVINPEKRLRERYVIKNFFNCELHLTIAHNPYNDKVQNEIEIEYQVDKITKVDDLLIPIKFLFDLLYVKSIELLTDVEISHIVYNFNNILIKLKERFFLTREEKYNTNRDYDNIRDGKLISYEDKPISILKDDIIKVKSKNYFVTNKLNGTRYYLFNEFGVFYLIGKTGSKLTKIKTFVWKIFDIKDRNTRDIYILDGEYFNSGKNDIIYHAFDIILATNSGKEINLYPYEKRLGYLNQAIDFFKTFKGNPIQMKNIRYGVDTYKIVEYMKMEFKQEWDYDNDGLIYTPARAIYSDKKTPTLKWKFDHHQSLDVRIKRYIDQEIPINFLYECFVDGQNERFTEYLLYSPEELIEDSIIEVSFDTKIKQFYKLRSRPDKENPNFIKVANDFWEDINRPIPITELSKKILIVKDRENDWFQYFRYSNSEKDKLIKENIDPNSIVIDIGFGKGGDIFKYATHGIKNIIAIEPDIDNIKEFYNRYKDNYRINETTENATTMVVNIEDKKNRKQYNVEILLINKSGSDPELISIINYYLSKNRNNRPLVATMFFSLTYFFGRFDEFVSLFNILFDFNPTKILGTFMDGEKAKLFINQYEWDEKYCGFKLELSNQNMVYIQIFDSATVSGHNEYLCDFSRLNNFASYYQYNSKRTFFNYNMGNDNLLTYFASLNCSFIFDSSNTPNIALNNLINKILNYNFRLALPGDSSYFYRCLLNFKNEFSYEVIENNIFNNLFNNKPFKFDYIVDAELNDKLEFNYFIKDYQSDKKYDEDIYTIDTVDNLRFYLLTGLSTNTFILTYEVPMNDTIKKNIFYNSNASFKLTNIVYDYYYNKEENDAYQVFNILKENISKLKDYTLIESNIGVGNYTIIFIYMFKDILCIDETPLNIELSKHNISLFHNVHINKNSFSIKGVNLQFIEKSRNIPLNDIIDIETSSKYILFVNYQVNRYNMPSLDILRMVKNIKFIIILSNDIIFNISEYFTKVIYYKLVNSYIYIIDVEETENVIILKDIVTKGKNIDIGKPISKEEIIEKWKEINKEQIDLVKPYYKNLPIYLQDDKKSEIIEKYEKQFRNAKLKQIHQIKNPRERELMLKAFYWPNWVKSSKNINKKEEDEQVFQKILEEETKYAVKDTSDIDTLRKKDIDIILNEILLER